MSSPYLEGVFQLVYEIPLQHVFLFYTWNYLVFFVEHFEQT